MLSLFVCCGKKEKKKYPLWKPTSELRMLLPGPPSPGSNHRVGEVREKHTTAPHTWPQLPTHCRNVLWRHLRLTVRCEPRMKAQSTLQPTTEGVKENESVGVGGHTTNSEVGWVVGFRSFRCFLLHQQ